jgi:hypothetical protein
LQYYKNIHYFGGTGLSENKLSFKLLSMDRQVDSQNLTSLLFGMDKGFFFFKGGYPGYFSA